MEEEPLDKQFILLYCSATAHLSTEYFLDEAQYTVISLSHDSLISLRIANPKNELTGESCFTGYMP